MSSVMHPVGPEPEQTYWVRRLLVITAAVLLVALVIALVIGGTSTGSAVSAQPSPPPVTAPAPVSVTPTVFATPSETPSATPSASDTASPSPSDSASPSPSPSESASTSARKSVESASPSPSAKPTKAAPTACSPKDLRATLTGKRQLEPDQATTFALSLINGTGETCVVEVTPETFELKIYSGTDRIWSSDDCPTAVKTRSAKIKAEDALTWSMRWDGKRSRADCKTRPEIPRPGTYFATAQLDGAKPVQLRMILRG